MKYAYENLGDEQFETLIVFLCQNILGIGVQGFSKGKDGGRDAKFVGTAELHPSKAAPWNGIIIIQSKHTNGYPVAVTQDGRRAISASWDMDRPELNLPTDDTADAPMPLSPKHEILIFLYFQDQDLGHPISWLLAEPWATRRLKLKREGTSSLLSRSMEPYAAFC
jgi:hypothetical protein